MDFGEEESLGDLEVGDRISCVSEGKRGYILVSRIVTIGATPVSTPCRQKEELLQQVVHACIPTITQPSDFVFGHYPSLYLI
jgi:hypothetical protein